MNILRIILVILSSLVTICATLPYIVDIIRGKTKPRIVSWFTWTLLTAIACAASFADHQYPTAILMFFASVEVALIVILGFKHGDRKFEPIDIVCQCSAFLGLVLWFLFNSPAIAVIAAVTIDFIGCIPTLRHSWRKPHEETWITFLLSGVGGGLTLLAAGDWRVTAVAYPAYLLIINILGTTLILASPHRRLRSEPIELRQL